MTKIEIYTKNICNYCDRAKEIFKIKKLTYLEYNIEENPEHLDSMLKRSNGKKLMPQIFINNVHIGGYDDLKKIIDNDGLKKIIDN
tara:strand:+ start:37 stop:294 length:258 start_codon:yes stop_codon:yes gene_type:complete